MDNFAGVKGLQAAAIKKAFSVAMEAHKLPEDMYQSRTSSDSEVFFAFPGSWSVGSWFTRPPFGEIKIDQSELLSPKSNERVATSLRTLGRDEPATVNEGFLRRFEMILSKSSLQNEVNKAIAERKQIVFTGHSSGGAIAILATVWYLEECFKNTRMPPLCVTFGSPLVADFIFNHALRRESWSQYFLHFVMRYDIAPRIMLAPLSSMESELLQQVLNMLNLKLSCSIQGPMPEASRFYATVMRNASAVATNAACKLMGNTNPILETVASLIDLSPYRPSGTFVFFTGNGKLVVVKNADAILQLLFYSSQLSSENELEAVAKRSLNSHFDYQNALQESLNVQNVVYLDHMEGLPLSSNGAGADNVAKSMALNDLGLSTRARLCLRAAGEQEKQKLSNQQRMDGKKQTIEEGLAKLEDYMRTSALRQVGYYDAFRLMKTEEDFKANILRLELTGIWDEIIEMLNRYELPEEFETRKDWVELGTRYRRIVEPLDVANYYRHAKNEDTGPYMNKARPRRFRYTQRWREHTLRMAVGSSGESCFWAEVEELLLYLTTNPGAFEGIRERVLDLERKLVEWVNKNQISNDVFLEGSSFTKLWKSLPDYHKSTSPITIQRFIKIDT